MITIENVAVSGFEAAVRGMRNAHESWSRSDSMYKVLNAEDAEFGCAPRVEFAIGSNDRELMIKLCKAGSDHRKYLRMIDVSLDITAMQPWWAEFDTYKVGTVRNSCSKMHRIHVKTFSKDDFEHLGINEVPYATDALSAVIDACERLRNDFNATDDKRYWRALIELLPEGYRMRSTVHLNYEVLRNMYHARKAHKLVEWQDFCRWIETLPCSELITIKN